ncbi:hypothetical protein OG21DRAFT_1417995 [Imleria badia]|nr:hypothetical protein OG21DRAFT_1417995 [Imleria badia]
MSTSPQPPTDANEGMPSDVMDKLSEGMESLLRELGIDPGAASEGADGVGERERLAAAWEAMLVEGMDGMADPSASTSSPRPMEDNFQSRVRSTQSRLKESESGLKSSDSSTTKDGDSLQSLLSQLQGLGEFAGDGAESESEIQGVLEEMMGHLMSKNVLYEPLKELHEKASFPEYLTRNASTLSPADKARFEAQVSCIKRLIDEFEAPTYRDDDGQASERIVGLMSELQTHGQPPQEIMGPLPPGLNMGADGLPDMPEGCNMN